MRQAWRKFYALLSTNMPSYREFMPTQVLDIGDASCRYYQYRPAAVTFAIIPTFPCEFS